MSVAVATWAFDQLIKLRKRQPELVDAALERLVEQDEDLRWSMAVNAYLDEEISLSKAAELLDMHPLVLQERFLEMGIPILLGPETMAEARAEIEAARGGAESPALKEQSPCGAGLEPKGPCPFGPTASASSLCLTWLQE